MTRPTAKQKQWLKACEALSTHPAAWPTQSDTQPPEAKRSFSAMWLCVVVCFVPSMCAVWFPTGKPVGGLSNASKSHLLWQISHHWPEINLLIAGGWYWEKGGNEKANSEFCSLLFYNNKKLFSSYVCRCKSTNCCVCMCVCCRPNLHFLVAKIETQTCFTGTKTVAGAQLRMNNTCVFFSLIMSSTSLIPKTLLLCKT